MNFDLLKILLICLGVLAIFGATFKILREYERAVVFRLGKFYKTKGPGLIILIPLFDQIRKIDLRLVSIDVPRQDIMTRDNVPVTVDAVVYFNICDPARAVITIQDIYQSTFLLAQATLRNVLGQAELDDLLSQQGKINEQLQKIIAVHTKQWGINISIVEIKEVTLPEQMKRAMAKQAETERERRARLIDAQAEYQASQTLSEAGKILSQSPQGFQLRYLQTLRDISANKGSTVLFPLPMDLLTPFLEAMKRAVQPRPENTEKEARDEQDKNKNKLSKNKEGENKEGIQIAPFLDPEKDEQGSPAVETQRPLTADEIMTAAKTSHQEIIDHYKQELSQGRLKPQFVQWMLTSHCQFSCSHCEGVNQTKTPELNTAQAQKAIDGLVDIGCKFLSLTGGEPLLRKDFFEIVQYAKGQGMRLSLTTNGQITEEYLIEISEAGFDAVVVTLDSYGESLNHLLNTQNAYERGLRTIEFFHDIGTPRICVSTTLLDDNLKDFPRLTEDVFRSGANLLQIQPRIFQDGKPLRNSPQDIKEAFRFILEARRRGFPVEASEQFGYLGSLEPLLHSTPFFCGCGWNTFGLNPEGKVKGCPTLTIKDIEEGDCNKGLLSKIWQEGFASFRNEPPKGLWEGCTGCPHITICRGGCWLFYANGLNPCFLHEAEDIYREITNATIYPQTP